MKALLSSLDTFFLVGQFSPIQKCNMDGWPIVGVGHGKVGILDNKAHECDMDKGPLVGDGNGKVGVDSKDVGGGGGWNFMNKIILMAWIVQNWVRMARLWETTLANTMRMTRLLGRAMAKWVWGKAMAKWMWGKVVAKWMWMASLWVERMVGFWMM
jgi:hypothetical protein